jgi:hypothetical protein
VVTAYAARARQSAGLEYWYIEGFLCLDYTPHVLSLVMVEGREFVAYEAMLCYSCVLYVNIAIFLLLVEIITGLGDLCV